MFHFTSFDFVMKYDLNHYRQRELTPHPGHEFVVDVEQKCFGILHRFTISIHGYQKEKELGQNKLIMLGKR